MSFLLPNSITSAFKSAFADSTFRDSSQPSGGNISADLKAVYQAACISWLAIHRVQSPVRKASGQNSNQGTDAHDPQPQDEGESGDSSEIDILFYFSKELAVTREQIRRQIRVLRGATDFYLSMMTGEGQVQPQAPQNQHYRSWVIHSQKHRNIVLELGDDVWLMVSLQAPRWLRASTPKLRWQYDEEWRPDTWIVSALGSAWDTWVMLNGSATSFLRFPTSGRAELERSLEKYFSVWASRWDLQSLHNEGDQKHPFGQPQKQPRFKVFSNLLLVQHPVNPSEDLKTKRTTEKFDSTLSDIVGRRYTLSQRGTRKGNEELLREAMIFRGTCRLSCRSVAGTKPSSNDDVRILIDHVLATYGPLITPPDRGDLGHTPDGVATVTPATSNVSVKKDVRGNSSRLSFLSFWGAAEDQEQAAPTAAKVDDPAKPTKSVLTALATSAPEQTDPAPRAFPSISVTSSAWFSKSSSPQLPGPIESSDAVDNEGSPGKRPPDNTEEAKELEEEADPPEFQTFKLVAWPRRHADGTEAPLEGKRVRLLFVSLAYLSI
ncbi:hypothetical protein K437DRAFT_97681 [Tilletiaria anomala UBC 951]|uniref:CCZ1/INTU/HSP4 first Longin domain-containing protein n=1 Tax=Tilletiaria anomala (strain ATCC 24038 / CBS 436.72 / UBC 951) TaxID=1037660 RepID=A0A066WH26_TILAU|nr:uncharacterized protein K437DRAFT_97681 [Tilletiaria anomala UBC 951]KDN53297.1 hypothetical protein K437DRAFT_97681 [Tilletiaria anomala UBC 951]